MIGGGDFAVDRIIPDCIRAVQAGKPLNVRNPSSIRPYQHVLEPLFAYLMVAQRQYQDKQYAGWYNVGPDDDGCVTTGELAERFKKSWGGGFEWLNQSEANAVHEDNFLKLDCSKLKSVFGWRMRWTIDQAIEQTVEWVRTWLSNGDIPTEMDREIALYMGNV